MRTARSLTLTLTAAASLLALAAPADAATGSWSATRGFTTGPANSGAVWSGAKGLGASLATDGVFRKTAEPKGPPPPANHSNSTNRDLRTAGRYAIFAWGRAGRVRVAVRDFGA